MFWKQRRVYADAAAATPLSSRAKRELERLLPFYGNAGALHKEGVEAKKELEHARKRIANAIGAHADEIVFTASGTEANNLAIHGVLRPLLHELGEMNAITSAVEHQSVLEPLYALEDEGLYVTELSVDEGGLVDAKNFGEILNDQTGFVSVQLVNSEIGTIEPIRELAKVIRRVRPQRDTSLPLIFHTDASQAPLWLDIQVEKLGVDLMTLDAQKVLGPKGIGCLYIRRGVPIEPILWGGKQERGLRGGTENVPLAGAFAVALEDAQKDIEARVKRVAGVRDALWNEIQELIPGALLNGPKEETRVANNLNISIPGLQAEMAVVALDAEGVAVSTRSACEIGKEEPSHVIKAIGVSEDLAGTAIRITLLPDATSADARYIAKKLAEIAQRYRNVV